MQTNRVVIRGCEKGRGKIIGVRKSLLPLVSTGKRGGLNHPARGSRTIRPGDLGPREAATDY
jgi:hypothetical protein